MNIKNIILAVFTVLLCLSITAQNTVDINHELLQKNWPAKWITHPDISGTEYGVYLFRKTITLDSAVKEFIVHLSADNRYKLYVNENYVTFGPARGDFLKWNFESIDIAPYLKEGKNMITAEVWNFGEYRPVAQFSFKTGFIIQGNSENEQIINSDKSWKIWKDEAYTPIKIDLKKYYVVGPGDNFNGALHPWDWKKTGFDDSKWQIAKEENAGKPNAANDNWRSKNPITLQPRNIPAMEEIPQRFASVRRSDIPKVSDAFIQGQEAVVVPANSRLKILLDHKVLTNAYPVLNVSKGKNSSIKFSYAESLFENEKEYIKGNRNEVENKTFLGNYDVFISDGGENRIFQTLWWRTFRYVELEITTKQEELIINDIHSIFTAYPFQEKASFKSNNKVLSDIWKVGWHTQRLCAGECYFDCPYYEQLQYVGDTRIQALVSTYVSGDILMMRNAISSIHDSHMAFGLTQSRYPSYEPQIIPPFSLVWVTMVHDYMMLENDKEFIKELLPTVMDVLNWYERKIDSTQMLGKMEWWNFVDWNWKRGVPPGANDGNSAVISLQYIYTLQKAVDLFNAFGMNDQAARYLGLSEKIKTAVYSQCFDKTKNLIADTPAKNEFSQHANTLAVLTNTFPINEQKNVMNNIIGNTDIEQCTFYFKFYIIEALQIVGLGDKFIDILKPWEQMLDLGLSTFAEQPDPTRSDCHAWSASPVYYFLSLICGIQPETPGFNSVRIEPHLGDLEWIEGKMPHKLGEIKVSLKKAKNNSISGTIMLPQGLKGTFIWKGEKKALFSGENKI